MTPRGKKWQQEAIIDAFRQVHGNTYDYSRVVYKGSDNEVLIGCKKHPKSLRADENGIIWFQQTPHHHLAGEGCPICNESHTERLIANHLSNIQINYERYKPFAWLPKGCHIDFYLPDYNIAIEYQGELHYLPKFGEDELAKQQQRDSVKRELCKQHKLPLYEIKYTEDVLGKLQEIIDKCSNNDITKTNENMKKNVIKLNENTLRKIVAESVKKVLKEGLFDMGARFFVRYGDNLSGNIFYSRSGKGYSIVELNRVGVSRMYANGEEPAAGPFKRLEDAEQWCIDRKMTRECPF